MDKILLNQEINVFNSCNALAANSLAGTKFDNDTTDPVKIIDAAGVTVLLATGKRPNRLLLPTPVLNAIKEQRDGEIAVSGAASLDASLITLQQLAAVFKVEQVVEAPAIKVTSAEGQAAATDFVWGKNALLYYVRLRPACARSRWATRSPGRWGRAGFAGV